MLDEMAEASDVSTNHCSQCGRSESNVQKESEIGTPIEHEATPGKNKGPQNAKRAEGVGIFVRGGMSFRSSRTKTAWRQTWEEEMAYNMRDDPLKLDETASEGRSNATSDLEKLELERAFSTADNDSEYYYDDYSENTQDFYRDLRLTQQRTASGTNELNDEPEDFLHHFLRIQGQEDLMDIMMWQDLHSDGSETSTEVTYPLGELTAAECLICFEVATLNLRPCCAFPACNTCLETYFQTQVSEAIVKIPCPNTGCPQKVHRDEIIARLSVEMKVKFNQFLVDANKEPHRKTCPRCSNVMTIDLQVLRDPTMKKFGVQVECTECGLDWCFPCQAPWHEGMKCKEYRRGDKLVKAWALERPQGQVNAQRCPKCKIFIQRSTGCDHMTCSQCNTHFCYQCGEKFREFKFIGNHYSRLSIFGCKYLYNRDKPIERKLVRGSIFGAKLLAAPILGGLALGAGAVVAGIGLVVLPFYGGYKLHKKLQLTKEMKRQRADMQRHRLRVSYHHDWEPQLTRSFPNIVVGERSSSNDENLGTMLVPPAHDLLKDEIDRLEKSFFHVARADSLIRCTHVMKDGDQSSVSDASAATAGPAAAGVDSSAAKDFDQSTVHAFVRLKTLAEGRLETPADDGTDFRVTKVLNSDSAVPAAARKTEEITERLGLERPILAISKCGEIFV